METLIIFIILLVIFILFTIIHTRGDVYHGTAKVVSRRVEAGSGGGSWRSSNWNYLVTFQFTDGDQIELYTTESEYGELKEGLTGQLAWYKNNLSSFEPDMEVTV